MRSAHPSDGFSRRPSAKPCAQSAMRRACAAERRSRGLGDIAPNLPRGADGYRHGVTLEHFDLGRQAADSGAFVRQDSSFRDAVSADGSTEFPAAAGRYHLYVARACPWAHRTLIVRTLKGLEGAIDVSYAHPFRDDRGWAFPGGDHVDQLNGFDLLSEAYERTDPAFEGRVSVPVLWDKVTGRIVNNESSEIIRMLNSEFDAFAEHPEVDLYPEDLRAGDRPDQPPGLRGDQQRRLPRRVRPQPGGL